MSATLLVLALSMAQPKPVPVSGETFAAIRHPVRRWADYELHMTKALERGCVLVGRVTTEPRQGSVQAWRWWKMKECDR